MLCVPVLVDLFDCSLGRRDRGFLPSADMAERLTCEIRMGLSGSLHRTISIVVGFVARHDFKIVAARDART